MITSHGCYSRPLDRIRCVVMDGQMDGSMAISLCATSTAPCITFLVMLEEEDLELDALIRGFYKCCGCVCTLIPLVPGQEGYYPSRV